ncbi:MAG: DUF4326 domain-containing protein [Burkholderiaceae bacterium]|nr:DUF4326 domain-containing protein [Burkholderiaceae bacterium]
MTPQRVQLRRTKGWRMPADAIKVDRSTRWGNPFCASSIARPHDAEVRLAGGASWWTRSRWTTADTVAMYDAWMRGDAVCDAATGEPLPKQVVDALPARPDVHLLRQQHLACWCRLGEPCHADVLLRLAASSEG